MLADRIAGALGVETLPVGAPKQAFTPEATAGRILEFVGSRIDRAADGEQRSALMEQARAGIERGFEEARDVLQGLGVLQGRIAEDVDRTYDLIQDGLKEMQGGDENRAVESVAAYSRQSAESRSGTISIETRDGDTIDISFNRLSALSEGAVRSRDGAGETAAYGRQSLEASGLSISVEGNLDADERKAVDALLKDVDQLSERFFAGDTRGAFAQAMKLNFDSEQLSGLDLDLQHTQVRREVAAYAETARPIAAQGEGFDPFRGALKEMQQLLGGMEQTLKALEPDKAFGAMLEQLGAMKGGEAGRDAARGLRPLIEALVQAQPQQPAATQA